MTKRIFTLPGCNIVDLQEYLKKIAEIFKTDLHFSALYAIFMEKNFGIFILDPLSSRKNADTVYHKPVRFF